MFPLSFKWGVLRVSSGKVEVFLSVNFAFEVMILYYLVTLASESFESAMVHAKSINSTRNAGIGSKR